jgi:hypothetical protein
MARSKLVNSENDKLGPGHHTHTQRKCHRKLILTKLDGSRVTSLSYVRLVSLFSKSVLVWRRMVLTNSLF